MRKTIALAVVIATLSQLGGAAQAALNTSNAYTDGSSFTWVGSTTMTTGDLSARVDWVVKDRVMHAGELQFQYLYQTTGIGSDAVTKVGVGMLSSNEAQDIGFFSTDAGDIAPTSASFAGSAPNLDSANWFYAGLVSGDVSEAMEYWSVNEPQMGPSLLQDGGLIAGGLVPSPSDVIPEPATIGLLAFGAIAVVVRRRKRVG